MATFRRKHVLLLFAGGATIETGSGKIVTVAKPKDISIWLQHMPEMDILADTSGEFIASGQTMLQMDDWRAVLTVLTERYDDIDGFVVVHQYDSLPFGANVIAQAAAATGKPIVVVSSPILSLAERKAGIGQGLHDDGRGIGAKAGFINAVQVAASDVAGVFVVHGSTILLADGCGYATIGSESQVIGTVVGKIDFGIRFQTPQRKRSSKRFSVHADFDTNVTSAEYVPGMDMRPITDMTRRTRGLFLSVSPGVRIPPVVISDIVRVLGPNFPVALHTPESLTRLPGVVIAHDPSRTAAYVRFLWALGRGRSRGWKKLFSPGD